MSGGSTEIGRCSVCQRMARLNHGGCADCGSRLGRRFVELAARVRRDHKLAAMILEAIRDPVHKELFVQHFGSEGNRQARARARRLASRTQGNEP